MDKNEVADSLAPLETILVDARKELPTAGNAFIGIKYQPDCQKPYLAVTIHHSARFKSQSGAVRWFRQNGSEPERKALEQLTVGG
jgi:hypothetical protein